MLAQPQQGFLDWHVEDVFQLGSEIASRGLSDADFRGGHQGTVTRKPNRVERPQVELVENSNFIERVERTAVGIAGPVGQFLELAASVPKNFFNCGKVATRFLRRNCRSRLAEKTAGRIML